MTARPGKVGHEPSSIGPLPQCQGREIQPGRPALRSRLKGLHGAAVQIEPERPVQEPVGLVRVEAELVRAELSHRPHGPQATHRQGRVGTRRDDEMERSREVGHQGLDQLVCRGAGEEVVVIEDEDQRLFVVERIQDPRQHLVCHVDPGRSEESVARVTQWCSGAPERRDDAGGQPDGVAVTRGDREPRGPHCRAARPCRQQRGLPVARRRRDEGQRTGRRIIQPFEEVRRDRCTRRGWWRCQLCAEDEMARGAQNVGRGGLAAHH